MGNKRSWYKFEWDDPGSFSSWVDDRFDDAVADGVKGVIIANEGKGAFVVEGSSTDVDSFVNTVKGDTKIKGFKKMDEVVGVTLSDSYMRSHVDDDYREEDP